MDSKEYYFFTRKRNNKIYLSKSIESAQYIRSEDGKITKIMSPIRYASRVGESEQYEFIREGAEVILRSTSNDKQEVRATFFENSRHISTLQIQRFSVETGFPHKTNFTFVGEEIWKLYYFIQNIPLLPIKGKEKQQFEDKYLDKIILTKKNLLKFIHDQPEIIPELIEELQRHNLSHTDIKGLAHRKEQLEVFGDMLYTDGYFEQRKKDFNISSDESVWQNFFEENSWILGYGLTYIFNTELDEKKLEQVVKGFDFNSSGKRVDLLMKTKGLVNSLCFGEIKTHKTPLLKDGGDAYRRECWGVSDELSGGVAQIQKTVQKSLENIKTKTEIKDKVGDLTGEQIFLYQPKSFLLIGSLNQFIKDNNINEDKFSSFELFRRNLFNPEIITFDELYERAKHIVNNPLKD